MSWVICNIILISAFIILYTFFVGVFVGFLYVCFMSCMLHFCDVCLHSGDWWIPNIITWFYYVRLGCLLFFVKRWYYKQLSYKWGVKLAIKTSVGHHLLSIPSQEDCSIASLVPLFECVWFYRFLWTVFFLNFLGAKCFLYTFFPDVIVLRLNTKLFHLGMNRYQLTACDISLQNSLYCNKYHEYSKY